MALPPDVRAARDFRITKGLENMIRTDYAIATAVTGVKQGEWVVLDASNQVTKTNGEDLTDPAQNVVCSWMLYAKDDNYAGHSDANATGQLTCISGPYQAETKFFESTGTFTAGFLLVVQESTTTPGEGVLNAVDGASATAKQIAASIGRVVSLSGGVLTYRTNGQA